MEQINLSPFFTIIVVCLNAGDKLTKTVNSILEQDFQNIEILVKDGLSKDGSVKALINDSRIRVIEEIDTGIYDAMNQAVQKMEGEYVLFLNCGDTFYDKNVLSKTYEFIMENTKHGIYYGDTYCEQTSSLVASAPSITPFTCYRNIPCHQSCFYQKELLIQKPYDTELRVRADYDHFLWCYFKAQANPVNIHITISTYEGGGYSESRANRKRDKVEYKLIIKKYIPKGQRIKFAFIMALTLAPLRRFLAEKTVFSKLYHKIKAGLYR